MRSQFAIIARRYGPLVAVLVLAVAFNGQAFATDPVMDYPALVAGAKTELITALVAVGPVVFGILGILTAVSFAWKYFKRAAKSS